MAIADRVVEDVRQRVDIVEFIGRSVDLKPQGASFQGRCPVHDDHSPSMNVDPRRRTWKCFACGAGGDVFRFVMETQNVKFPEAVRLVAASVGVEVEESGPRRAAGPRRQAPSRAPAPPRAEADVRPLADAGGQKLEARIEAVYEYRSRKGRLLYQVVRLRDPKSFRQRRPHPKREGAWVWTMKADPRSGLGEQPTVLYRIPELAAALSAEDPIWICEGEKDVEAMMAADQVATCNSGGAGKWHDALSAPFKGFQGEIRILQDRDEPGEKHARQVLSSLADVVGTRASLAIYEAASGKDAADHLGAGLRVADFVQVFPVPDDLLERDPERFKRLMLRRALEHPTATLRETQHQQYEARDYPLFPAGLRCTSRPVLWQGCVVVSGEPSSGKSYLTISTAVDAAMTGWEVFYLTAEMAEQIIRDRAARAQAAAHLTDIDYLEGPSQQRTREECIGAAQHVELPESLHIVEVGIGVSIEDLIEFLSEHVSARPTLVVIDSISSFVDAMVTDDAEGFSMRELRDVTRWVTGVSRLTHGQVAFLLLSEINREGRAKGRFLDHRCDHAIALKSSSDEGYDHVKEVRVTKSWHARTGKLGDFVLWWQLARLARTGTD